MYRMSLVIMPMLTVYLQLFLCHCKVFTSTIKICAWHRMDRFLLCSINRAWPRSAASSVVKLNANRFQLGIGGMWGKRTTKKKGQATRYSVNILSLESCKVVHGPNIHFNHIFQQTLNPHLSLDTRVCVAFEWSSSIFLAKMQEEEKSLRQRQPWPPPPPRPTAAVARDAGHSRRCLSFSWRCWTDGRWNVSNWRMQCTSGG